MFLFFSSSSTPDDMSLQERDGEVVIEYDETVFRIEDAADPD